MKFSKKVLTNGLRVITVPMPSSESTTVTIWVKTGSRNEDKKLNGISHFLEHMVFKGGKKRPTAKEISETVDSIGAEFNAGTNKDWTNFYIKCRNASIETAFDVLSDMVLTPILDKKEIEREKGTIIQEIAMYEDTPVAKIGDVFEGLSFEGNPLSWEIAGKPESVKRITQSDFLRYREIYYYPENMIVSIAGGVAESVAIKLATKYFQSFNPRTKKGITSPMQFEFAQTKPGLKVRTKKLDQAHFILGYIGDDRNYEGRFSQAVLAAILGGGMSSRLFIEVRERRGLAYAVRNSMDRYQDTGYFGTYSGTDPVKAEEAIKVILDQFRGLASKKYPILPKEFKKAKEYIKGQLALGLEDTGAVGEFFAFQELFNKGVLTPEDVYKKIDKVTTDDVYFEAKKLFVPERLNLAVIGPFKDEKKFVKLLQ
jgi:predicted Zn-dependent peptidase